MRTFIPGRPALCNTGSTTIFRPAPAHSRFAGLLAVTFLFHPKFRRDLGPVQPIYFPFRPCNRTQDQNKYLTWL